MLLIDLQWRGTEGLKLARLARSLPHRKGMPIILVAESQASDQLAQLARRSDVTQFVEKTPDMSSISEAIQQSIGNSKQ